MLIIPSILLIDVNFAKLMEEFIFKLSNGIRVIFKPTTGNVAHCGFIINTGSRDETLIENGIAHFIEHAIFKGTLKRKTHHILNRIDSVGGEINAFTTKENTSIYASFTTEYFERATELLSDIVFNSTFPEKELTKEKEVIIDEIYSYQDTPYEQIYDDFEGQIFKNHPLGMNILGSIESISNLKRNDVITFLGKHYSTENIVFSIVGNFPLKKVQRITEKHLGIITQKPITTVRENFTNYVPQNDSILKDTHQAHYIIGNIAYGSFHQKRNTFMLLNNILGGPAMNSRLNMGLREKYGLTYNIESSYNLYCDVGLFSIYLGTDIKHIDKSIHLVKKEMKKLKNTQLSSSQLKNAKRQFLGQTTIAEENNCNVMLGQGKSVLLYNKVEDLATVYEKINAISHSDILDVANEIFDENQLSSLLYQPEN